VSPTISTIFLKATSSLWPKSEGRLAVEMTRTTAPPNRESTGLHRLSPKNKSTQGHGHQKNSRPRQHGQQQHSNRRSPRFGSRAAGKILILMIVLVLSAHWTLNAAFHQSLFISIQGDGDANTRSSGSAAGAAAAAAQGQRPWNLPLEAIDDDSASTAGTAVAMMHNGTWTNGSSRLPSPPWPLGKRDGCVAENGGARPYCKFHNLLIDMSLVTSKAIGGESLWGDNETGTKGIMGQAESDEYLAYRPGAFRIVTTPHRELVMPHRPPTFHYVNDVLSSLKVDLVQNESSVTVREQNCASFLYGTTLFLQRYEYVNLYHTLTDWWNTWTVYRHLREDELAHFAVVFLDAHPQGNLDPVWTTLFGKYIHLRRLDDDALRPKHQDRLCFQRAMLVPPGYVSHLWPEAPPNGGRGDPAAHEMMDPFVDFVLDKFQLTAVRKIPGRVVIIDRKPYVAHPRSRAAEDRSLANLPQVAQAIKDRVPSVTSVRIVQLHIMTFREQVEAIRQAEVLVGNHGAGLSHLVFMDKGSHVIEFQMNNLMFFVHLTECKRGQVTFHQLPDVRSEISEEYLNSLLLPKFYDIYGRGTPPTPPPTPSPVRPHQQQQLKHVARKSDATADQIDVGRKVSTGQQPKVGDENHYATGAAGHRGIGQRFNHSAVTYSQNRTKNQLEVKQ
jgi:glycoprotein 2-beta-D-xylosyltransferase